ncbi:MAG: heme ABC transporter ATP-binding protein [Sporichthyaceae bacterium]
MSLFGRAFRLPGATVPGQVVLSVQDVSVTLGGNHILRGVDLEVRAGQVLALVGPNGAGKSTLLAAMTGDVPAGGTVLIDGAPLNSWTQRELALRRGVLSQRIEVTFPFSAVNVVRMGRAPWAGTPAQDWDDYVVAEAMAEADVLRLATRTFNTLSGGERARVGFARILAQEPSLLLLDEPTAALDIKHQESLMALVRSRAARGDAVVVVMHDLALAAAYSDEIAVLHDGVVAAAGRPADVLTSQLLSTVYEHPIEVWPHPHTGEIVILPVRPPTTTGSFLT